MMKLSPTCVPAPPPAQGADAVHQVLQDRREHLPRHIDRLPFHQIPATQLFNYSTIDSTIQTPYCSWAVSYDQTKQY